MKNFKFIIIGIIILFIGIVIGGVGNTQVNTDTNKMDAIAVEPTKESGKVEVKSETKRVDFGYTKVVGEVINNTKKSVSYVKVRATFYDDKGVVIGTGFTYAGDTTDTALGSGESTPFEVTSYPNKFDAASYKLQVTWN